MPSKLFGNPSGIPWIMASEDTATIDGIGGRCVLKVAASTLLYGDAVFLLPGGRVDKSLEASLYPALFVGIVVGGSATSYQASSDSGLIGTTMSTIGQNVIVQIDGAAYAIADATGIKLGDPLVAGQTTAGRVLGGQTGSYSAISAGLVIKAGASALVKAANAIVPSLRMSVGIPAATTTAANLDMAALAGATANLAFAIYVFRVAGDGTTVTSAKSADAASLALVVWPAAGTALLATLGFVVINPTGTGGFVGGTTALDDATVVPNAKYYNLVGTKPRIGVALAAGGAAASAVKIAINA